MNFWKHLRVWLFPSTDDLIREMNSRIASWDYSQENKIIARDIKGRELFTVHIGLKEYWDGVR